MSTTATTAKATAANKKQEHASSWSNVIGLMPYLGRYPGAITLGLVVLVHAEEFVRHHPDLESAVERMLVT